MTTANPKPNAQALVAGVREAYENLAALQKESDQFWSERNTTYRGIDLPKRAKDLVYHLVPDAEKELSTLTVKSLPAILGHLATVESELGDLRTREKALAEFVERVMNYLPMHEPSGLDRKGYYSGVASSEERALYRFEQEARHLLAKLAEGKHG